VIGLLVNEREHVRSDAGREVGVIGRLKSIADKLKVVASWS
jgi:hypothetical protein